jgi:hypothetical protein
MNALAAFLGALCLIAGGFWTGYNFGKIAERRRLSRAITAAKGHLLEAIERFARSFPQDVTIQVVDKDGTIIAEGSTRPDKGDRIH